MSHLNSRIEQPDGSGRGSRYERGSIEISILSFLLGAFALYYFAGPFSRLADQSYYPMQSGSRLAERRGSNDSSQLERFGNAVTGSAWYDSARQAYTSSASAADSAYNASLDACDEALGELTSAKKSADSDWRQIEREISDLLRGLNLNSFNGQSSGRRVQSRRS